MHVFVCVLINVKFWKYLTSDIHIFLSAESPSPHPADRESVTDSKKLLDKRVESGKQQFSGGKT